MTRIPVISHLRNLAFIFFIFSLSTSAWAARGGVVDADEGRVFEKPNQKSKVIETLRRKTPIAASNLPINGFYRVRTPSGQLGWMVGEDLELQPAPEVDVGKKSASSKKEDPSSKKRSPASSEQKPYSYLIRGFGGLSLFKASGIIPGYDSFGPGITFGGDFVWMFAQKWGFIVRVDRMVKNLGLSDSGTNKSYLLELNSMPISAGAEYRWLKSSLFSGHLSLLVGYSPITSLRSTSVSDSTNNVTEVKSSEVGLLTKVDLHFYLFRFLSIFGEVGYRYQQSPQLTVSNTGAYSSAVINSTFKINLSGPFVGGGVSLAF